MNHKVGFFITKPIRHQLDNQTTAMIKRDVADPSVPDRGSQATDDTRQQGGLLGGTLVRGKQGLVQDGVGGAQSEVGREGRQ